jgi:mannose-1-phosphate guanylyltransferase
MLSAMVLAAGLGSRLRPLTDERAKPLVPVGDRPALAHVLDRLKTAAISRIVVNAHHRIEEMQPFVAAFGAGLSEEKNLLGTAGGISRAAPLLGSGSVLVWNADVLAEVDPREVIAAHERNDGEATLVVQRCRSGHGPVGMSAQGRIVRLRNEQFGEEAFGGEFLGLSVLGAALRARLPARGCLVGDSLVPALRAGALLRSYSYDGPWVDIGTPRAYLRANMAWLEAQRRTAWIGNATRVAVGVTLDHVLLGDGARVTGTGELTRCVVWPGAHAIAPLVDAVVTRRRVVLVGA